MSEFFMAGHPIEYIEDMSYWKFIEIQHSLGEQRKEHNQRSSGNTVYKKIKPSQQKMMEERKKQRSKEGIRSGR